MLHREDDEEELVAHDGNVKRWRPTAEETSTFPLIITSFQQRSDVLVISWNQMKTGHRESLQRILGAHREELI